MNRVLYALSASLLIVLYFGASDLKYKTLEAKDDLRDVERAIALEAQEIKVLNAEWSHLTRPDNLRKLAQAHLGLGAVRVEQIAAIEDVPYLGMNLFDQIEEAIPVKYQNGPRNKPNNLRNNLPVNRPSNRNLDPVPSVSPLDGPIQVAQIELVLVER